MAINPYYIPAKQPLKQWQVDQYAPLPIKEISDFGDYAREQSKPYEDLQGVAAELNPWYSDIDEANAIEREFNEKAAQLASDPSKYSNPNQYRQNVSALTREYAPMFKDIKLREQASSAFEKKRKQLGEKGLYGAEGKALLEQGLYSKDPITGKRVKNELDYTADIESKYKYKDTQDKYFDNAKMDRFHKALSPTEYDAFLQYGFTESNRSKIDKLMKPSFDAYIESPEGRQQLEAMTGETNFNNFTPSEKADAREAIMQQMIVSGEERKQYREDIRPIQNPEWLEAQRQKAAAGEKEEQKLDEEYVDFYKQSGKGGGTMITQKNLEALGKQKNSDGTYQDFSQNKILIPANGNPQQMKLDQGKFADYTNIDNYDAEIDDSLNALLGLNNEILGLGDNATSGTTSGIKKMLKDKGYTPNKAGLKKALIQDGKSEELEKYFRGIMTGEGGSGDNVGSANYNALLDNLNKRNDILGKYSSEKDFFDDRDRVSDAKETFEIGLRIRNRTFNSNLATNDKGTNARNINGTMQVNWKGNLTKEDIELMVEDGTLTWDNVQHLVEKGILEGKVDRNTGWTGGDLTGFDATDLEGENYKLNYAGEEVYSEQVGESYTGDIHKNIGVTATAKTVNARRLADQRALYSSNNAKYTQTTDVFYNGGKKMLAGFPEGGKIYNELKSAYSIKQDSDRMVKLRRIVEKYGIQLPG